MFPEALSGDPESQNSPDSFGRYAADRASQDFAAEKEELEWVLSHPEISRSTNLVRFLSFICNKYFNGELKDIREHTIAIDALGRKESSFDSHADPIVRVTARTLSKKLQPLYATDGRERHLQILLPVGRYVPQFVHYADAQIESNVVVEAASTDESVDTPDLDPVSVSSATDLGDQRTFKRWSLFAASRKTAWKWIALSGAVPAVFLAGFLLGRHEDQPPHPSGEGINWGEAAWTDEFDGAAKQLPDPSKWTYDLEKQEGLGPHEHEVYCSPRSGGIKDCDPHHPNAFLDGMGHLVLRAQKNANGVWTLVRITTKGVKDFRYGRIEARMKMPVGKGLWPALLMVGADKDTVGWPTCGSIDVAENVSITPGSNGLGPTMIRSTLHGPRYFGSNGLWHDFKLPNGGRVDDDSFHTYGIIWSPGMVQFYLDDPANVYLVHDTSDVPEGGSWVFDHPFYLMMSLATGGDWAGDSDASTPNPADLLVDYVRAYKIPTIQAPNIEWHSMPVKAGSSTASTIELHASKYASRVHLTCATDSPTVPCSLAASILNFSDTLYQQDTLTLSTNSFT